MALEFRKQPSWVYHQYNNGRHNNECQDAHHQVDVLWMCKRNGRINIGNKVVSDCPMFICEIYTTERNKHKKYELYIGNIEQ